MPSYLNDFRYAFRTLLRRPGFTLIAILTLALGIGANAVIFSVAHAVLLRPLPYHDPDRLVRLLADSSELGVEGAGLAAGDFQDFRRRGQTVADLSAYASQTFDLTGGERPEVVRGTRVSPSLFPLLGANASLGRTFSPEEESTGRDRAVILSDGFWRRHFAASPDALRRFLEIDGERYQVVGVMPAGFHFPREDTEVWLPLALPAEGADRMSHYLGVVGRLRDGTSLEQAGQELASLARALEGEHPDSNEGWTARAVPLQEHLVGRFRPALFALMGAVGLVLLIACANLVNLLLARGMSRCKETAVRAALGAARPRLVGLFLAESLLLSLAGGVLGLLLATWGVELLVAARPENLPRAAEIGVDGTVVLFGVFLSLVTGLVFGSVPALQLSRPDLNVSFKGGDGTGKSASRLRSAFVVSEVALSLVLLIAAGLMFQGFLRMGKVDPGFRSDEALGLQVFLSPNRYPDDPAQVQFFERLLEDVGTLPEVREVGAASAVPLNPLGQNLLPFEIEGKSDRESEGVFASFSAATPGYFRAVGIPLLAGRAFNERDTETAPPVVVVNEVMARRFWRGESPVGKRLRMTIRGDQPVSYEVVGVVGATRDRSLTAEPEPAIYASFRQVPHSGMIVVVRTSGDPTKLANPIQDRVYGIDPNQPVFRTFALEELVEEAGSQTRFYVILFAIFATVGLVLAGVGLYGVIAYSVSRRMHEMSVRIAIGAKGLDILRLVVGDGLKLSLAGVALGLLAAFGLTRLLSSLLYGVGANDPLTFALVPLILIAVAAFASYLPAQRALRANPVDALREG